MWVFILFSCFGFRVGFVGDLRFSIGRVWFRSSRDSVGYGFSCLTVFTWSVCGVIFCYFFNLLRIDEKVVV